MTDYQWNKLIMLQCLLKFLVGVETRVTTAAALITLSANLVPVVAAIELKSKKQIKNTNTQTAAKNSSKDAMIEILAKVARGGKLYAEENNKPELIGIFNYKPGKLQVMREGELKERAESIYTEADKIKTNIAQYGVTQAKLDQLNTWINGFNDGVDLISTEESTRIAATQTLPELFTQADSILDKMDDIVDIIDDDYPDFGVEYRIAREIKNLGGGHNGGDDEEPPTPGPTPSN